MDSFEHRRIFEKGRSFWLQYVQLNGYAFRPNMAGVKRLSQKTNIKQAELRRAINIFLEA